jgi:AI-2 transport protein TqsA
VHKSDIVLLNILKIREKLGVLVNCAAVIVIIAGLKVGSGVLVPFIFALFMAILGSAPLAVLLRLRVPRVIATFGVAIAIVAVVVSIGGVVARSANDFSLRLPEYIIRVQEMALAAEGHLKQKGLAIPLSEYLGQTDPRALFNILTMLTLKTAGTFSQAVLVLIAMMFMLVEAVSFRQKYVSVLGERFNVAGMELIVSDVQRYLGIKTITSALTGFCIWALTLFMGLEFSALWGLIAFLFNYIPVIGSIVAAVPALILCLIDFGGSHFIWVGIGYLVINNVISNLLEPVLMGRKLGLSPLVVFFSLFFWGWLWGPAGALMSVPIMVIARILLEHNVQLHWLSVLIGTGDGTATKRVVAG